MIAFVIEFGIEVAIAFAIQPLEQINFTIASTSESDPLTLCMYMHRYHASIYIYIQRFQDLVSEDSEGVNLRNPFM